MRRETCPVGLRQAPCVVRLRAVDVTRSRLGSSCIRHGLASTNSTCSSWTESRSSALRRWQNQNRNRTTPGGRDGWNFCTSCRTLPMTRNVSSASVLMRCKAFMQFVSQAPAGVGRFGGLPEASRARDHLMAADLPEQEYARYAWTKCRNGNARRNPSPRAGVVYSAPGPART